MSATGRRARSAKSIETEARLLRATLDAVADRGIDRVGLRDVAERVGLTHGAVYSRWENAADLLVDVWLTCAAPELEALVAAAERFAAGAAGADDVRWLEPPGSALLVVVEAGVASARVGELGDVVAPTVRRLLEAGGAYRDGDGDVRHLLALAVLLGRALHATSPLTPAQVGQSLDWLSTPVAAPAGPPPPPDPPAPYEFAEGATTRDEFLGAAVGVIARSGVEHATLKRIARAAGYTQSALYAHFATRHELLLELCARANRFTLQPERGTDPYRREDGTAARLAGWALPANQVRRRLALEVYLAALHDPAVHAQLAADERELVALGAQRLSATPGGRTVAEQLLRTGHLVVYGVSWLAELVDGLDALDWRPATRALLAGAAAAASAAPASSHDLADDRA